MGFRGIASISRKKICHNFFPIQNAFDHVTMFHNALCSFSPKYNFNLEQQLTPERSEGVSSCSNLKLYEGLKEGEKEHLYASNT